jgi:hypothetical protein
MRNFRWIGWPVLMAMLLVATLNTPVRADDDPPGRVARLNFIQGTVSFRPAEGGDNDWVAADPNRPLTIGDRLWTDNDGWAELHVGSTAIRMDHNTGISFLNVADNGVQIQVSAGTVIVRLRHLDSGDSLELDAPNLALSLLRPGNYRLDVDPDKFVTTVTVVDGQGEVTGGGRTYDVAADQSETFMGMDNLEYDLADAHAVPPTDFDQWAADRDGLEDKSQSVSYVSPETTGAGDLDANGDWRTDPDYGHVWVPSGVPVGWAPYRYGHWVWISPWGWTWVEDEPWGFAPFHYGRWAFVGGYWAWVPGPVVARPVYAPALVAWVGAAPGFSFSVGFGVGGGVGWFPLGPREVFVPTYRVSEAYVTRVNVTNTVVERTTVVNVYRNQNVTNVTYANQRVNGGVTAVSRDTFVNARPVSRNVVNVPESELAAAPVSRGVPFEPSHASIVGAGRPGAVRPPAAVVNRSVVAKRIPPLAPARFGSQPNGASQPSSPARPSFRPPQSPSTRSSQPSDLAPSSQPASRQNDQGANEAGRQQEGSQAARSVSGDASSNPTNPNVRPAPATHTPTPAEQQQDTQKQQGWQQQHDKIHPNRKTKKDSSQQSR